MAVPVLVVTPTVGFGELIVQVLEEAGGYALALATNTNEAIAAAQEDRPAVLILDADFQETPLTDLVNQIRGNLPDLLLILMPQEAGHDEEELDVLRPDGFIAKPFYLPDLVTTIADVVEQSGVENIDRVPTKPLSRPARRTVDEAKVSEAPDWLGDVSQAAQYLTRLSLESASQASLITRQDQIWAYAGELPQPAVEELARTVAHYFGDDGSSDLARFIHLDATGGEYMLYATGLGGAFVLAVVFDAEMPFSKIRSQANEMAQALSATTPNLLDKNQPGGLEELFPDMDTEPPAYDLLGEVPPPIPSDWAPAEPTVISQRGGFMDELLDDAEPERVEQEASAPVFDAQPEVTFSKETSPVQLRRTPSDIETDLALDELEPQQQDEEIDLEEELILDEALEEALAAATQLSPVPSLSEDTIPSQSLRDEGLIETAPSKSAQPDEQVNLQPVSAAMSELTYACLLIPRFPNHHLTGDVVGRLSEWVKQLCVAFGWRLEHLAIRPEYLQWVVNVPPSTTPGYLMRIIRQHTSRRLFAEFPRLQEENPSTDFWAPGYLIMSGKQPPPVHLVQDFIKDTRKRQGLSK